MVQCGHNTHVPSHCSVVHCSRGHGLHELIKNKNIPKSFAKITAIIQKKKFAAVVVLMIQ